MFKPVIGVFFALIVLCSSQDRYVLGQDYIGVLPEMLKPELIEKLGLSEEQQSKVQELIRRRSSAAIGLSQQLREAPLDQQGEMRAAFSAESEKMGFDLLDAEQKSQLAKYRVEWMGMLSLDDPYVADSLNLADWQRQMVGEWVARVQKSRRRSSAEQTRNEAQQAIRKEISDSQWATWQVLAGQIAESDQGPPLPPEQAAPESMQTTVATADVSAARSASENALLPVEEVRLELNFRGQPWSEVIDWLAEQADLSLQSDVIPPGSFNFHDRSRTYTVTEAMDRMNASLLSTGHTLVRSGRMLLCINFEDQEISGEYLKEIADLVSEEELSKRGDFEPVKHIFDLNRLDPDDFKEELEQLRSVQGTIVSIPSTGQLVVTDMARNIRAMQRVVRRAEDPNSSRGASIQTFGLKHINAEEVLAVARPLLDLEEDSNTNDEIKISTDTFGTKIYAMGDSDKVQNLRDLIEQMDVAPSEEEQVVTFEKPELRRHRVVGLDLQLAYDIVSQLLAGAPDIRLAQDAGSKQLMLLARPSEHELVENTLADIAGDASDFIVIQLQKLDTQMAIAAIKKFFGLSDEASPDGAPVIDGDLLARQVWVKGSTTQVKQIQEFLENLEKNAASSNLLGDTVISVPLSGRSARRALDQVQELWDAQNGKNRIRFLRPSEDSGGFKLPQKSFAPNQSDKEAANLRRPRIHSRSDSPAIPPGRFTSVPQERASASDRPAVDEDSESTEGADILILEGAGGLIISSADKDALARFEAMLRLFADQAAYGASEPTVVYLKNITAAAAKELLEATLSGTAGSGGGGGLLGDMAGSVLGGLGGGMFGSMLGGGGGDLLSTDGLASGDYTITADPRLNALIIKASAADMALIEQLLEVIDQIESPLQIDTRGQVALIPVVTQEVQQVVDVIKQLYGDRIEGNSPSGGRGGGGQQPNPADIINALRGGGRNGRSGGSSTQLAEPKIAITAEPSSNILIVIAQPQDIAEIKELVQLIDEAGAIDQEEIGYSELGGIISGSLFENSIQRLLGPQAKTNVSSPEAPSGGNSAQPARQTPGGGDAASDAARQAQRAAFFERLRQGGGGGFQGFGGRGGGGGPGGGGGGGGPGGRGGGGRGGR